MPGFSLAYFVNSVYFAESSRSVASAGFETFSPIIQDPCGSLFTISGFSVSEVFTSITSPLTGAYNSDTAFTDSIVPKTSPYYTVRPTSGSSR